MVLGMKFSQKHLYLFGGVVTVLVVIFLVALPFFLGKKNNDGNGAEQKVFGMGEEIALPETGLFRSDDGGATWRAKNTGDEGLDFAKRELLDLKIASDNSLTLYAGAKGVGLWKSSDRGDTWQKPHDANLVLETRADVYRIALDPRNANRVYLAVFQQNRGRVLKSDDGARSFVEVYASPLERFGVFDIFVDRRGEVYIATGAGEFLKSTDGGRTWRMVRRFADGLVRFFLDPANAASMFVVSAKGNVFSSYDAGKTWQDLEPALKSFAGSAKNRKLFPDSRGTLFIASDFGLLRSQNGGRVWEAVPVIIPTRVGVSWFAPHPANANIFYITALSNIYKTSDGGESWQAISAPSENSVSFLSFDQKNPEVMYAFVSE
jgi:photosystem II stability/assembly factor-like uncharacterized protein